jgi:hypothetical protein
VSLKKTPAESPPTAVNQKDPGFGRFSPGAFEWRFAFFSESLCGNLNAQNWPT